MATNALVSFEALPNIDEAYKTRLAEWVIGEKERTKLTDRALADRMGVSYGTLQFWRSKKIRKPLTRESVEAIARYRCESPGQTQDWLDGQHLPVEDPLIRAIQEASIPELVEAVKAIGHRLDVLLSEESMGVSSFLLDWLVGHWAGSLAQFEEQVKAASGQMMSVQQIRGIVRGLIRPTDDDLFFIGAVVLNPNGKPYSLDEWKQIRDGKLQPLRVQDSKYSEETVV